MRQLEAEKFELQYKHTKQKYEVRWHITDNHTVCQQTIIYMDRF